MLEITFEHKHCKTICKGYGSTIWEAYKNAEILTAEGRNIWKPINVTEYYEI